jgi:integrase
MATDGSPRRGWREKVEPGVYRSHRLSCPSSHDQKAGRRCRCSWQIVVPGDRPGTTRLVTVEGAITDARATRRSLQASGRPTAVVGVEPNTLDEFAAAYFAAKAPVLAPDTIRNRDEDYCSRIAPALGRLLLSEITRERVEVWLAGLVQHAPSRRMVVQTVATLRVILGAAVEWERIATNPAVRLTMPSADTEREQAVERVLNADQLQRLFAAAGSLRTETMLRAAGEAGLRRGEVAGLKWPDVDLSWRRLSIRRSIVQERATAGSPMRKIEKTTKGRRARRVAITGALAARLADWYSEAVIAGGATADGYVWPGRGQGPMHDRSLARALERASARAGLLAEQRGRPVPMVTPHGLRHTCASIMLCAGVPGVDPGSMTPRPFRASARRRSGDGKDTTAVPGRVPARGAQPDALGGPDAEGTRGRPRLHRADAAQLAAPRRSRPR